MSNISLEPPCKLQKCKYNSSPPAGASGSQPNVNHILRVRVDLPEAEQPGSLATQNHPSVTTKPRRASHAAELSRREGEKRGVDVNHRFLSPLMWRRTTAPHSALTVTSAFI